MCYTHLFDQKRHSNPLLVYLIHMNPHCEPLVSLLEPQLWVEVKNAFLVSPVQETEIMTKIATNMTVCQFWFNLR